MIFDNFVQSWCQWICNYYLAIGMLFVVRNVYKSDETGFYH